MSEPNEDSFASSPTRLEQIHDKAADDAQDNVRKMFVASCKLHADAKARDDAERLARGEPPAAEDKDETHDLNGLINLTLTHLLLVEKKAEAAKVETLEGFIEVYLKHKAEWPTNQTSEIDSAELMMAFGAIDRALGINKSFAGRVKKEDDGNPSLPPM